MSEINKKEVGERIKRIRLEMGYTQKEFVKAVTGVSKSPGTVVNWENGYNLPDAKHSSEIAFQGQMSVDELLHGKREFTIEPIHLFNQKNDIRKYLNIDVDDAYRDMLKDYGISEQTIENVLKYASIYVNMTELPNEIPIEIVGSE